MSAISRNYTTTLTDNSFIKILGFLSPSERQEPFFVCKRWMRMVSDPSLWPKTLKELKCRVYGESAYDYELIKAGELSFEGTKHINEKKPDIATIMKLAMLHDRIRLAGTSVESLTILTLPQNLSLKLIPTVFNKVYIPPSILEALGETKVKNAYQVIITDDCFEGTRFDMSKEEKSALVKKVGCVFPNALEGLMLIILANEKNYEWQDRGREYTYCRDVVDNQSLIVGCSPMAPYVAFDKGKQRTGAAGACKF